MYDGLDKVPVKDMNFQQLREQVQQLRDLYEVLIRRNPELATNGSSEENEIDWANIVTQLIRAKCNRIEFRVMPDYANIIELEEGQTPESLGQGADKGMIYAGAGDDGGRIYWYWNGNEWKQTKDKNIFSYYEQTPAGFYFKGVQEIQTDTDGRLTISDTFIKMYPEGADDPKIQIGYNPEAGENNNPVILLGTGAYNDDGTVTIKEIGGYPVRQEQGILTKTADGILLGMVSNWENVRYLELNGLDGGETEAGLFWHEIVSGEEKTSKIALLSDLEQVQQQIDELKKEIEALGTGGN